MSSRYLSCSAAAWALTTPPSGCHSAYWSLRWPCAAHSTGLCGCPNTSWSELTRGSPSRSSKSAPLFYGRSGFRSTDGGSHSGLKACPSGSPCCLSLAPFAACTRPRNLRRRRLYHQNTKTVRIWGFASSYLLCILLLFIRSLIFGS